MNGKVRGIITNNKFSVYDGACNACVWSVECQNKLCLTGPRFSITLAGITVSNMSTATACFAARGLDVSH